MYRIKIFLLALCLTFSTTMFVQADPSFVDIALVTDDNIVANITGIVNDNGTITVYVDGIEIKGEISKLWSSIEKVDRSAKNANWKANNNRKYILLLQKDIENNTQRIYLIKKEIIAFEEDYFKVKEDYYGFKNTTEDKLNLLKTYIEHLAGRIEGEHQYINKWVDIGRKIVLIFGLAYIILVIGLVALGIQIKKLSNIVRQQKEKNGDEKHDGADTD